MTRSRFARRKQHARAARQAVSLCEAELLRPARSVTIGPGATGSASQPRTRISAISAMAVLLVAGLPPRDAARFRGRLRVNPEQEASS
jgi:hypothetical protein